MKICTESQPRGTTDTKNNEETGKCTSKKVQYGIAGFVGKQSSNYDEVQSPHFKVSSK